MTTKWLRHENQSIEEKRQIRPTYLQWNTIRPDDEVDRCILLTFLQRTWAVNCLVMLNNPWRLGLAFSNLDLWGTKIDSASKVSGNGICVAGGDTSPMSQQAQSLGSWLGKPRHCSWCKLSHATAECPQGTWIGISFPILSRSGDWKQTLPMRLLRRAPLNCFASVPDYLGSPRWIRTQTRNTACSICNAS